jgi:two-component system OmpR family sensor kinase
VRTPPLRIRLAIVFTVLVGAILVGVGVLTFQLLRQSLLEEIGRDVSRRATTFQRASTGPPYQLDVFGAPDVFLQVVDQSGDPTDRSGNLGERTLPLPPTARRGEVVEVHVAERPLFLTAAELDDGGHVIVARSPITTYDALGTLRMLLTVVVAGAVVLTALASWLYARTALRPIGRVVEAAREIRDSRDLARRVPGRGTRDEVGRLVETFNEMLTELDAAHASLDRSNHQLRQFLADCSHELRAPLSRIRSAIDLLDRIGPEPALDAAGDRGGPADEGFRSRTLAGIAAETDRMARMVRQLLILARADAGATIEPRLVRLSEVLEVVCRQAEQMANGVTLVLPRPGLLGDAVVRGNADHLEQVVLILLDNAVKYTPAPGEVRLDAERDQARARITVTDTGLGVPEEDTERIFDRFYRGRNAQAATGTGLGLAIAHWVVEQHGGRIDLDTSGSGSRFSVEIPLASAV